MAATQSKPGPSLQERNAATTWSAAQIREWNQHKVHMQGFHDHFRQSFEEMMLLTDQYKAYGLSYSQFIRHLQSFPRALTTHHTIEDRWWFPVLAERMPEFREHDQHAESHHKIHEGLDALNAYLDTVAADEKRYDAGKLQEILRNLAKPLFKHLGEEEQSLGMENMQKYWTLQEVNGLLEQFHSRYGT